MKIKKYMRSKTDEGLNDYIESLENYLLEMKASNTMNVIFKLDEINGTIVEDLEKINNGEAVELIQIPSINPDTPDSIYEKSTLKVLNDSKDSKIFERVMVLFAKLKDLQTVADYVKQYVPEVEEEAPIDEIVKTDLDPEVNAFEQMQKKFKGKKLISK